MLGCWFHYYQALIRYLFEHCHKRALYYDSFQFKIWFRKFGALSLVPLKDIISGWNNILDTIPVDFDIGIVKFIKYFVKNWLHGRYGFTWNHFANDGPRTNNHLGGYHAKLSKITSATSNNVLAFINMIKKSETETSNRFYNTERNPIEEPKQLPKNKRKDDILARLKVQYTKNIITFEQYFEKLAAHIVDPYEAVKIKFDLDDEVKDEIETGKKR
ncbi:hypothetical protein BpHYR1_035331 [Brachionus plicatilis]|uniref:MULE transposase domain-containing protein n=1 Tax=Brachionus plicatilis TaxID=10195 RepID=A0A3M7SAF9_BRAPC|nr:hypothetical protein BpHYR1_035331 [Brachionus plicatilis]